MPASTRPPALPPALLAAALLLAPAAAEAQRPQTPPADSAGGGAEDPVEEIVVSAERERGAVAGDIRPELQLGPADIRSFGVSSATDLIAELGPQLRSARGGPPAVLVNGQRVSGFGEIANIPTEAIARVDILPEEAALRYGFAPDQRVINFVLVRRFRATTAELEGGGATSGGARAGEAELGYLRIRDEGRLNLDVEVEADAGLAEADRAILPAPGRPDETRFRSLTADTRNYNANAVYNRVFGNTSATANARFQRNDTDRLLGLPPTGGTTPLTQDGSTDTSRFGLTLNGNLDRWRWTLTGGWDRVDARTNTQTDSGLNRARGTSNIVQADALVTGPLFLLPAGEATVSARAGATINRFSSDATRSGAATAADLSRNIASGQLSLDLPIASIRENALAFLGNLSVNGNAAVQQLSDFGTLRRLGGGVNWRPTEKLRLLASFDDDRAAPSTQQLGNPAIATPGVPAFDPAAGRTALVTRVTGGNPALQPSTARSLKLSANWRPLDEGDLTFSADYLRIRTTNPISAFPGSIAAIEAAFPDRFTRDADGDLLAIDARPVNFARRRGDELRWGVNVSKPLQTKLPRPPEGWAPPWVRDALARARAAGTLPPAAPGQTVTVVPGDPAQRPPSTATGAGRGFGGGGRGGFGGGGQGRLQLAFYHTVNLADDVLVRPGVPLIDLLDGGSVTGSGGQPRHELEAQFGWNRDGLGIRLTADWRSATRIDGIAGVPGSQLNFDGFGTANLRVFFNPQAHWKLIEAHPWLRGTRVSLNLTNILDSRQRVTDGTGTVPTAFQPAYLDPVGRRFVISLRKQFFPPLVIPAGGRPPR